MLWETGMNSFNDRAFVTIGCGGWKSFPRHKYVAHCVGLFREITGK